jgi:hypothetical protein
LEIVKWLEVAEKIPENSSTSIYVRHRRIGTKKVYFTLLKKNPDIRD